MVFLMHDQTKVKFSFTSCSPERTSFVDRSHSLLLLPGHGFSWIWLSHASMAAVDAGYATQYIFTYVIQQSGILQYTREEKYKVIVQLVNV